MLSKRVMASTTYWVGHLTRDRLARLLAHACLQDEPSGRELIFIVLNYATCIPVLLAVGVFR